jgi:hypothetical protein
MAAVVVALIAATVLVLVMHNSMAPGTTGGVRGAGPGRVRAAPRAHRRKPRAPDDDREFMTELRRRIDRGDFSA